MLNLGGVDILKLIIELEQRVGTLEKAIEVLNNKNSSTEGFKALTQEEYNIFRKRTGEELIKKYPSLGLKLSGHE